MKREIGEIFELQNEWYKVVDDPENTCRDCAFKSTRGKTCDSDSYREIIGSCSEDCRNDGTTVIFIKAEKPVGLISSESSNKRKLLLVI